MNKTLLVGIDFSDCSVNALEHAVSLAEKAEANIKMIWVNKPDNTRNLIDISNEEVLHEAEKRLEGLASKYQPRLKNGKIDFITRKGKVYKELVAAAEEFDVFLILIGTHGSSGFEEFWIGSNANRIVSATERPVITIRGGVDINRTIERIVMPIDSTIESRQKVPITALLAKYFNAEVHVLATHITSVKDVRDRIMEYVKQVERYLEENQVRYLVKEVEAGNISDSVVDYATTINANLISIMDEQEKAASNIWLGPYAQQMVNHSPIPVLVVHAKNYIAGIAM
ncbi:MAG TPA: universal stress protein [Bacteroidales bacterium]|jgi:nucleotide-binding universal stress UspA family protein|nr:universal stress protein [Bacteroidales bacterium]HPE43204.1 universal stress protein [Bacteroidales bacterium]